MSKRSLFTSITPLPPGITREAVIAFLHDHLEMIDLNPLVKERHRIDPPPHAEPEELRCTWYSLTDEITYVPGVYTADLNYTAAFYDLPFGMQTHCYAPMGVHIREKWTVGGSLPGEKPEPVELGTGAPQTGLYLREDVDLRCNFLVSKFIKKTIKGAHHKVADRISQKAAASTAPGAGVPGAYAGAPVVRKQTWHSASSSDDDRNPANPTPLNGGAGNGSNSQDESMGPYLSPYMNSSYEQSQAAQSAHSLQPVHDQARQRPRSMEYRRGDAQQPAPYAQQNRGPQQDGHPLWI